MFKYKKAIEKYRSLKSKTRNSISKNKLIRILTICLTNHSTIQNLSDYNFVQVALENKECMYIECMYMPVYKTQNRWKVRIYYSDCLPFFDLKRRTHKPLDKISSSYIYICGSTSVKTPKILFCYPVFSCIRIWCGDILVIHVKFQNLL